MLSVAVGAVVNATVGTDRVRLYYALRGRGIHEWPKAGGPRLRHAPGQLAVPLLGPPAATGAFLSALRGCDRIISPPEGWMHSISQYSTYLSARYAAPVSYRLEHNCGGACGQELLAHPCPAKLRSSTNVPKHAIFQIPYPRPRNHRSGADNSMPTARCLLIFPSFLFFPCPLLDAYPNHAEPPSALDAKNQGTRAPGEGEKGHAHEYSNHPLWACSALLPTAMQSCLLRQQPPCPNSSSATSAPPLMLQFFPFVISHDCHCVRFPRTPTPLL